MKKFKLIAIILVVLLASLAACTNQAAEDANLGGVEDGQNINQGIPAGGGAGEGVDSEDDSEEESEMDIIGVTWLWVRFDDTADLNSIEVADPTFYTLVLNADGSYNAKVDCNQVMGGYTLEGSSITFEPGITTLAECGSESLYNTFLAHLGNVVTFVMDGDNLVLNLWADGGNMVFAPAE